MLCKSNTITCKLLLKCEVAAALKAMKKRKTVGPDKITTEMITAPNEMTFFIVPRQCVTVIK